MNNKVYLHEVREKIVLKVGGINRKTFELAVQNQDFKNTDDVKTAYQAGGAAWLGVGYTNDLMRESMQRLLYDYNYIFPNTVKIVAPIAGVNGFPKIDDEGEINTFNPPSLLDDLISYMKWWHNFGIMPTALHATGGTPANMVNAGLPLYFQLNSSKLNKSTTVYEFENAILNGKQFNPVAIECYEINIREHDDIIQRYRT